MFSVHFCLLVLLNVGMFFWARSYYIEDKQEWMKRICALEKKVKDLSDDQPVVVAAINVPEKKKATRKK